MRVSGSFHSQVYECNKHLEMNVRCYRVFLKTIYACCLGTRHKKFLELCIFGEIDIVQVSTPSPGAEKS